jgi:hypothetical protein
LLDRCARRGYCECRSRRGREQREILEDRQMEDLVDLRKTTETM